MSSTARMVDTCQFHCALGVREQDPVQIVCEQLVLLPCGIFYKKTDTLSARIKHLRYNTCTATSPPFGFWKRLKECFRACKIWRCIHGQRCTHDGRNVPHMFISDAKCTPSLHFVRFLKDGAYGYISHTLSY